MPAVQVAVDIIERDVATFGGFEADLAHVTGSDAYETLLRSGPATRKSDLWLVRPHQRAVIDRHSPGSYPRLRAGELLLTRPS